MGYQSSFVRIAEDAPDMVDQLFSKAEIHFALDYNSPSRVGAALEPLVRAFAGRQVLIDHHQQPDPLFVEAYSDTLKSSTSEMIADVIVADEGWSRVDQACADNLLMVYTAARLMEVGAEPSVIHERLFDSSSLSRVQTMACGLQSMQIIANGNAALMSLSSADLEGAGYVSGDSEGLVNWGLSVDGVRVSVLLREDASGQVKMSFRSKGDHDVNEFARSHYAGGGHRNAAGGASKLPLDTLRAELVLKLTEWLAH